MEWLILLLLVPAILVPVVLLYGFAGCSYTPPRTGLSLSPPVNLTARAKIGTNAISLSWENTEPAAARYEIQRLTGSEIEFTTIADQVTVETFVDAGLDARTRYFYQVRVIDADENSSSYSDLAADTTYETAFDAATEVPNPQTAPPGVYCFVQRISASELLAAGDSVALKLRGAPAGNVTIDNIYISRVAGSGNPWDSAADLKKVITSAVTLQNDEPVDLDEIFYDLDPGQDLLIAFDFTATSGAGEIRFVLRTGVTLFFKPGVQQASTPIRDSDYTPNVPGDPRLYFVVTIGVV